MLVRALAVSYMDIYVYVNVDLHVFRDDMVASGILNTLTGLQSRFKSKSEPRKIISDTLASFSLPLQPTPIDSTSTLSLADEPHPQVCVQPALPTCMKCDDTITCRMLSPCA
jgi:hypothetical protein